MFKASPTRLRPSALFQAGQETATKIAGTLLLAGLVLGGTWLWWSCWHDSSTPFLPAASPADWIVYPKPPDAAMHHAAAFSAVFRRSFTLPTVPTRATLSVRVFKQGQVRINGQSVDELVLREKDWKQARIGDVTKSLRVGENEISVTVTNLLGPPALWLALASDASVLRSDREWQVSLFGAAWQNAAMASNPPEIRPGNRLFGREVVGQSLTRAWPGLLFILVLSAAIIAGRASYQTRKGSVPCRIESKHTPTIVLGLVLVSWVILYSNNLPQIAVLFGFDRDGHLQYIDYILQKRRLPLADDGWQMYQPPLFYLLSALMVGPFSGSASTDSVVLALRTVSALTGMVHLAMIFLCLRLVFPNQPGRQIAGLLLASFLPANLCLSHHVTNENLSALFLTVTLYFTLRVLREKNPALSGLIAIGSFLGFALLTKFSAVLAVPFLLVAVAWPRSRVNRAGNAARSLSVVLVSVVAVCGWHFARVWHRFGTPLIGNWDPRLPFAWWQDPGYHTTGWYARFGEALICPLFSSITGFADGVYSTLWGDGLCSGSAMMNFRPQWNYDLMNASYVVAVPATVLVALGGVAGLVRFLRRPTPEWFLMLGMVCAFSTGIALMSLRVSSYAQVKAFYALPALLPLCVLAVTGWDWLVKRIPRVWPVLWVWLLAWAMTTYAAFWIRSGNPFTYTVRGVGLADDGRYAEAAEEFSRALRLDTNSLTARIGLASAFNNLSRREEARRETTLMLQQHPQEGEAHIEAAVTLGLDGHYEEAVEHLRQAVTQEPDHPTGYEQLSACLAKLGRQREVRETCEAGLRVDPFNANLHHTLAVACAESGDLSNAFVHAEFALRLKPKWLPAQRLLALSLASLGRLDEAAVQYQQAIELKPDDPALHFPLAMILAVQGNAAAAVDQYHQALALQPDNVEALNNLAWILAANPNDAVRNGAEAVRLAERSCELTKHGEPLLLGTLAAAYAEAGRFSDAITTAEKARNLAAAAGQNEVAERNRQLLELYRAGKAFHEPPGK
jgi:tetratricopeptide (TPR) repeat protein